MNHPTPEIDRASLPDWLHWVDQCSSTNTWAIDQAASLRTGEVVFTRHQTAGRGQHGRIWYAPAGVLTASFVLSVPAAQLSSLSLAVGLAVIYAVEDLSPDCSDRLRLKWPNDVMVDRRKLAGILCDTSSSRGSDQARAIVGIGLNRSVEFAEMQGTAIGDPISLHEISSVVPDEIALLGRLRHYLLETASLSQAGGVKRLLPELRRRDALAGCDVTIDLANETLKGQVIGIDDQGRLQVRLADGLRSFTSGRVRWC